MSDEDRGAGSEPAAARKRPYEKPAVAWDESIETEARLMSACSKQEGAGEPCDSVSGAS